jgi:hypothetical protein
MARERLRAAVRHLDQGVADVAQAALGAYQGPASWYIALLCALRL